MLIMSVTKNGHTSRILASGWTQSEERRYAQAYENDGYVVTFSYGVWRHDS
jgi:hypothetical protein